MNESEARRAEFVRRARPLADRLMGIEFGAVMDDSYGMIQVVVPPAVQGPLRVWLASRGLNLFEIPVEDDLPTYGVGINGPDIPTA